MLDLKLTDKQLEKHLKRLQGKKRLKNELTEYAFSNEDNTYATNGHVMLKVNQRLKHETLIKSDIEKSSKLQSFLDNSFYKQGSILEFTLTRTQYSDLKNICKLLDSMCQDIVITIQSKKVTFSNRPSLKHKNQSFEFTQTFNGLYQQDLNPKKDISITLNSKYLTQALELSYDNKDDFISFKFSEKPLTPVVISDYTSQSYNYLILPIRNLD